MTNFTVVEKVLNGATVDCPVSPHPNVAFEDRQGTYKFGEQENDIMAARKLESFEKYLETVKDKGTVKIILLQLAHALYHIHAQELYHGEVTMENLRVSESKKKVVLLKPTQNSSKTEKTSQRSLQTVQDSKRKDIKDLGNIISNILQQTKFNDDISFELCKLMTEDCSFTSENVLHHPYFWNTDKKLRFLACIAQRCKNKYGISHFRIKLQNSHGVFDKKSWITSLAITDKQERDIYEECLKKNSGRANSTETVNENIIKDLAIPKKTRRNQPDHRSMETEGETEMEVDQDGNSHKNKNPSRPEPEYNERHLWSLVNFVRNQREHFWKQNSPVKACFLFDPSEGYWDFFHRRFPNLLPAVYKVVKGILEDLEDKEIRSIYFGEMAPILDLPARKRRMEMQNYIQPKSRRR